LKSRKEYKRNYRKLNPEAHSGYQRRWYAKRRAEAFAKLGNRCASENCRYFNYDGTLGCDEPHLLQVDHVFGDGAKDRARKNDAKLFDSIMADTKGRYQLLCPTCNWLKRILNREVAHP
jgi:hypothetical protein